MTTTQDLPSHVRVAVVGSGFAGVGMAVRLLESGERDFVLLERADDLGGTWRDNVYPGCACDVPSHLYSFSFAPNPDWSRTFSGQAEIWAYLRRVSDERGVTPHVRYGAEVTGAQWDPQAQVWRVDTVRGTLTADVLISGSGALSDPARPAIEGLDAFAGTVFHSAEWDHSHDLTGRRVAVIGTGASAIQFVPEIVKVAGHVDVYQRTPPWILPRPDRAVTPVERAVYRRLPAAQRAMRSLIYWVREAGVLGFTGGPKAVRLAQKRAERHLAKQVADPALRARLTPTYALGCKRVLLSNDYLPALTREHVEVVTDPITEVVPHGVVTADGTVREVDTIILGTGFRITELPFSALVRGDQGQLLSEVWDGSPNAYRGTTVAGFPNLFFLVGPNTGLGPLLDGLHDRVAGRVRHGRAADAAPHRRGRGRGARGEAGRVPGLGAGEDEGHRLDVRRLPELVPRRTPAGTRRCGRASPSGSGRSPSSSTTTPTCCTTGRRSRPRSTDAGYATSRVTSTFPLVAFEYGHTWWVRSISACACARSRCGAVRTSSTARPNSRGRPCGSAPGR